MPRQSTALKASILLRKRHLALCILSVVSMVAAVSSVATAAEVKAKNVIVMINDGAGWGAWDATAYWQYGSREQTPYAGFPIKYAMTTYPLNTAKKATHNASSLVNYDPQKAWDSSLNADQDLPFNGYAYLATDPTDSAAAGTALASGTKTYNNSINVDNNGKPVNR